MDQQRSDRPAQSGGLSDTTQERFTPGLIGFYLSCTVFAVAAAIAAIAYIAVPRLLPNSGNAGFVVGTIAAVVCVGAGVATWYFLRANRRQAGA